MRRYKMTLIIRIITLISNRTKKGMGVKQLWRHKLSKKDFFCGVHFIVCVCGTFFESGNYFLKYIL